MRPFYDDHCRQSSTSERQLCKKCGTEIATVVAFMAVHDEQLRESCAGPGRIWQLPIPIADTAKKDHLIAVAFTSPQAFTSSPAPPSFDITS